MRPWGPGCAPTLAAALACDRVQAFLPLPDGARGEAEATAVQYLDCALMGPRSDRDATLVHDDAGRHLRDGRLAVRWFEPETGPELHRLLTEQTRAIWHALRRATQPVVFTAVGSWSPDNRYTSRQHRIGPAARRAADDGTLTPVDTSGRPCTLQPRGPRAR